MKNNLHGIALSTLIAAVAYVLAMFLPIGGVAVAIVLGILIGNFFTIKEKYNAGVTYSEKMILAFAIALMGINLDFSILSSMGVKTLVLIIVSMAVTIFATLYIGKLFKIDSKFSMLLGVGNGVCGSSAIGAAAPIIKADKNSIGVSVAVVNLLGVVGIFLLPAIAFFFGLNELDSGILIGNTLQAVGQVTAAGFAVGDLSGVSATTVKMGRVLLLTPLIFILIYYYHREDEDGVKSAKFPKFILFFILFSFIGSLQLLPNAVENAISTTSQLALIVAMSAVGLKINFRDIKNSGGVALKVATLVFAVQIVFTLIYLLLFT